MDEHVKVTIGNLLSVTVERVRPISGGDISQAFLLETKTDRFFCKTNQGAKIYEMYLAEKKGLEAISRTNTIATPKVLLCEKMETGAFLLMEYIEPKKASRKDMELLGHQLAALHKVSGVEQFGWDSDNFIGNLPQANKKYSVWADFYVFERLLPQMKMALAKNLLQYSEIPSEEILLKSCSNRFPYDLKPSLLHGDLWGGNYLISQDGIPYLIDPAVYHGHHEVDIAMTRLFAGFDTAFYDAYSAHFPKIGGETARNAIYQLYYLLVHLNLFGGSYKEAVTTILKRYF
ncbi:fructosamine kinase family protein [Maribacter algicola]|uniref:Fructosamine kinase family protein n=1 Tax=Meishania litoralis TaxID=3434685 RepID=A0ACC7LMB9_9FLAO